VPSNEVILLVVAILVLLALLAAFVVALILWHVYFRTTRLLREADCSNRISRLESLNAALVLRYVELARKFSEVVPDYSEDFKEMADSLIKLLHAYQDGKPLPAINFDVAGNMSVRDVTGRDKETRRE